VNGSQIVTVDELDRLEPSMLDEETRAMLKAEHERQRAAFYARFERQEAAPVNE
jgi:hypothetical protein